MMDRQAMRRMILEKIQPPVIPPLTLTAADFGILPNVPEPQTGLLRAAIDALSARGGGRLVLPGGVYRSGALRLRSGVELHLAEKHTCLRFLADDIDEHYPIVLSHWEASPCYNYSALLYACGESDIAVTGQGTLDGGADEEHWWDWHHQIERSWSADKPDLQLPARRNLRRMNRDGVPVEERIFGAGHYLRPNFVQLIRCERVFLQGVTLRNSPMWQLNPVFCRSVTVDDLTLSGHGVNNDGCDPESCRGVWIKNCHFDTGDDCISLKSGRDRDGREANTPCEYILIENNEFAGGHGGVALGSEMSGGIRCVLACGNHFSSPDLTYALRLKTNARRGGFVEQIMLCDSEIGQVHGAAVHGTMLYEDGRNGDFLPVFRDIAIENVTAHGGDYGVFLEAFPEAPITGLVLRNIRIDGTRRSLRGMNWQDAVVENVVINGQTFPRPCHVRILGVPRPGAVVYASAESGGGAEGFDWLWETSSDGADWHSAGEGERFSVPAGTYFVRLRARDKRGNSEYSRPYRVLSAAAVSGVWEETKARLACRGLLGEADILPSHAAITRGRLARMLLPLADPDKIGAVPADTGDPVVLAAVANGFFPLDAEGRFGPEQTLTRQEMATVAMEACGVNYRNASSTMPVCADAADVSNIYGTNVARALYFGFMALEDGAFHPLRTVTVREAAETVNRVADFAGL